jgi:hypothetical protein
MKMPESNGRVLDHLVEEARREETPTVDWSALEASLMERVREVPVARARRRVTGVNAFLAAAFVLGVGGVFFVTRGGAVRPGVASRGVTTEAERPEPPGPLNGDKLAPGAVVASAADAVVVEHRGHATWTLSPESSAHVEAVGEVVAIALDHGEVAARVVKSPQPESFVVRVERTRIAVHGTHFKVTRLADSVRVDVDEGVVGVGPVGQASTDLRAPDGATFTFDGVRTDAAAAAQGVQPAAPAIASQSGGATAARQRTGFGPPPLDADGLPRGALAGIEQAMASVERCLREHTVSGDDLRVSVETKLTLRVGAEGSVGEALFAPPLAPAVGACVDGALVAIHFPRSTGGFAVNRVLELNR